MDSMRSWYLAVTTFLLSLRVGVSSPAFSLKSAGSHFHFCTTCALEVVFELPWVRLFLVRLGQAVKKERPTFLTPAVT